GGRRGDVVDARGPRVRPEAGTGKGFRQLRRGDHRLPAIAGGAHPQRADRGVGQFLRTITDVQQITNSDLKLLGALPTLYDSRTTHSRDVLLDVADRY